MPWVALGDMANDIREATRREFVFEDVVPDNLDLTNLTAPGRLALDLEKKTWRHAQTAHFYVHYERRDFARYVAWLAEFLYEYIARDLEFDEDIIQGRSHIFIFENNRSWDKFADGCPGVQSWMFSFVYGPDLFLQRNGSRNESGKHLAHEMTHLIIFRHFGGSPPLWLNEGLAQWYEENGYTAAKGIFKSKKAPFKALKKWFPLDELFELKNYPPEEDDVRLFYTTAHYMTGFLLLEYPPARMSEMIRALNGGMPIAKALNNIYQIAEKKYLDMKFESFAR